MIEEQLCFELAPPAVQAEPCVLSGEDFCDSLEDVPVIESPLGCWSKVYLLLPPWDMERLAKAYRAANWRWSLTMEDRKRYWEFRQKPEQAEVVYIEEMMGGVFPTVERLGDYVTDCLQRCRRGEEWSMGGGLTVFRSKSGKIGLGVDAPVGTHYKRLKDADNKNNEPLGDTLQ